MRLLVAFFVALSLAVLPLGGAGMAGALAQTPPCHQAPAQSPADPASDMGKACAEHCLMQVSVPAVRDTLDQPSVRNLIAAPTAPTLAPVRLRGGEPPEPRPPRA